MLISLQLTVAMRIVRRGERGPEKDNSDQWKRHIYNTSSTVGVIKYRNNIAVFYA
jgi:hypothetical protein